MNPVTRIPMPPDPLRRFVPAEHKVSIAAARGTWTLETNDPTLIFAVAEAATRASIAGALHLRIIRDRKALSRRVEPTLIQTESTVTLSSSDFCVLNHDLESRQVVGFCAEDVTHDEVIASLLILLETEGREPERDLVA